MNIGLSFLRERNPFHSSSQLHTHTVYSKEKMSSISPIDNRPETRKCACLRMYDRATGRLYCQASVLDWIKNHLNLRGHLVEWWPTMWVNEHEIWQTAIILSKHLQSKDKWRWLISLNKAGFTFKINGQARWGLMMNELGLTLQAWWRKAFYPWHLKSLLLVNICHN